MDYLCDEVVPFVDERYPVSERRGVAGHSSGGYGATVCSMLRPDVFCAFASHAGDALFECCYLRDFAPVARTLRDHFEGSFEAFLERCAAPTISTIARFGPALSIYAMAAAYSPGELPFEIETGRLIDERVGAVAALGSRADGRRPRRRPALACAASTWTPAVAMSTSSTWARRPSRPSSRAWASITRWSCSTAATAACPTATRERWRSWCRRYLRPIGGRRGAARQHGLEVLAERRIGLGQQEQVRSRCAR